MLPSFFLLLISFLKIFADAGLGHGAGARNPVPPRGVRPRLTHALPLQDVPQPALLPPGARSGDGDEMSTHFRRFIIMFHAVRKRENSPTTIHATWDVTVTSRMPPLME